MGSDGPFPCSKIFIDEEKFSTLAFTVSNIIGEELTSRRYIVVGG